MALSRHHAAFGAGHFSTSLYMYRIDHQASLKTRIPVGGDVFNIDMDDDSSVAVALDGSHGPSSVQVYAYDGGESWHHEATWKFGKGRRPSVAKYGAVVVVGVAEEDGGTVSVYSKVDGHWQPQQIKPPREDLKQFGDAVAMHDSLFVVRSVDKTDKDHLWMYQYDSDSNKWVYNGHIEPTHGRGNDFDIQNDMIAVSVSRETRSGVVGTVYKQAAGGGPWSVYASLTAEPLELDQDHNMIRIDGQKVVTSRVSYGSGHGTVYIHDLSQMDS